MSYGGEYNSLLKGSLEGRKSYDLVKILKLIILLVEWAQDTAPVSN